MATAKRQRLRAGYDPRVDVLHIILGPVVPMEGDGLPMGVELDFAIDDGAPVGVKVIGYRRNNWYGDVEKLVEIVSKHLSVDPRRADATIRKAVASNA